MATSRVVKEVSDYPVILTVKEIAEIMPCSQRIAYEIMKSKGFPLIEIGGLKRVNRDAFFNWLETHKKLS